jgi:hypothetical protein
LVECALYERANLFAFCRIIGNRFWKDRALELAVASFGLWPISPGETKVQFPGLWVPQPNPIGQFIAAIFGIFESFSELGGIGSEFDMFDREKVKDDIGSFL